MHGQQNLKKCVINISIVFINKCKCIICRKVKVKLLSTAYVIVAISPPLLSRHSCSLYMQVE